MSVEDKLAQYYESKGVTANDAPQDSQDTAEQVQEESTTQESSLNTEENTESVEQESTPSSSEESSEEQTTSEAQQETTQSGEQSSDQSAEDNEFYDLESEEDVNEVLADILGSEGLTVEQVKQALDASKEPQYENELVKEIADHLSKGGTLEDYMAFKQTDFNSLSDQDKLAWRLKREEGLTDEEVQFELEDKYGFGREDEFDENDAEWKRFKINRSKDARKAAKEFNSLKEQYTADLNKQSKQANTQGSPDDSISQEQIDSIVKQNSENLNGISNIKSGDFSYDVSKDAKAKANEVPLNIAEMFLDKQGNINHQALNEARLFLANKDDLIKSAIEHGKSIQLKEVKEQRNNVDLGSERQSSNGNTKPTTEEIAAAHRAALSGNGLRKM